jgi:hypothetical protein
MASEKVNPSKRANASDGLGFRETQHSIRNSNTTHRRVFSNPDHRQSCVEVSDDLQAVISRWEAERYLSEEIGAKPLSPDGIAELFELGIRPEYIDRDWLKRPAPIMQAYISFAGNRRFFDRREGYPDAVNAFVFAVANSPGAPHSIIAWDPSTGRIASHRDDVYVIGKGNAYGYRLDEFLEVYPTLLSWLAHGRKGAFLRDERKALPFLYTAGPLHFLDPEQGVRVTAASGLQIVTVEVPDAEGKL